MEQQPTRRIPLGVAAGLSALILAAGGATAWWTWNSVTTPKKDSTPTAIQLSPPPEPVQPPAEIAPSTAPTTPPTVLPPPQPQPVQPAAERTAQAYWLKDTGKELELVPSQTKLEPADQPTSTALKAAFDRLLVGPANPDVTTTIPEGTKLRSVAALKDGVHVDLSQEFTTGGGSASMTGRVAQVLYTATSLEPDAKVWISVEGQPLEVLGGEGIELNQPLTRQSFKNDFTL
jgi:spore germination protein GerM